MEFSYYFGRALEETWSTAVPDITLEPPLRRSMCYNGVFKALVRGTKNFMSTRPNLELLLSSDVQHDHSLNAVVQT